MATYVLVHGGWGGAHAFRGVRPALRTRGDEVFTPTLTGLGERVHLASPQVNLTTHIRDLVNLVLYEDLNDIVLFERTYIKATAGPADAPGAQAFEAAAQRARSSPQWRYREIATNHMVPNNRPHELAELLLELR